MPLLNSYNTAKRKRGNPREYQIYNIDSMSHLGRPQNWMLCAFPFPLHNISIPPPHSFLTQLYCQSCIHPDYTATLYRFRIQKFKTVMERQLTDYLTEQSDVATERQLTDYLIEQSVVATERQLTDYTTQLLLGEAIGHIKTLPLKYALKLIFKPVPKPKKAQFISTVRISRSLIVRDTIAVYSDNHVLCTHKLSGQNAGVPHRGSRCDSQNTKCN